MSNRTTASRGSTPLTRPLLGPAAAATPRSPPSQRYSSRGNDGRAGGGEGTQTGPHGSGQRAPL